jgi:trimethylamine--corrinoid protein Co-methyltransferase
MKETPPVRRGRGERRGARGRGGAGKTLIQPPWRQPRLPYKPIEILNEEQLELIHRSSLQILEQFGIEILLEEARELYRRAGASIGSDGLRVHLDRDFVLETIAKAPPEFTLHARNPAHNVRMGGDSIAFCMVASAPNVSDFAGGRRTGNQRDYRDLLRLSQALNVVHMQGGYPVEPVDVHASVRHLECLRDCVTLTDKAFHAYSLGRERNLDALEIARIARNVSYEQLAAEPSLYTVINANSPLRLDIPMLHGIIEMARHNQVVVVTPFTLAGAMAPITLAGALAQQNAEALAGIVLTQLVRPGAPVVYGGFTSNVDMKSGAPAFGTPEYVQAAQISGQLARRYGLPYRSSNVNAANTLDAQASYESVMSLWGAVLGGANMVMHAAGWMEGGLCASFEKTVLDADLLQMMSEYLRPPVVDEATLAMDAIAEVGPGGHYFGTAHTQARYKSAFYAPLVSDWRNFESWEEAGSPTAVERTQTLYRQLLDEYQPPPLDEGVREALDEFVAKRTAEGGVATDF